MKGFMALWLALPAFPLCHLITGIGLVQNVITLFFARGLDFNSNNYHKQF